jgi:hypothetical protein
MSGLREPDVQMQLFVLLAAQTERHRREADLARSTARREIANALGQIGNQLALALWRGDELANSVRHAPLCPSCRDAVAAALERYNSAPTGRLPAPSRYLPVLGSVQ